MDPASPDDVARAPAGDRGHGPGHERHLHLHTAPMQPLPLDTAKIIWAGLGCWAIALALVLLIPSWHTGSRDWWPWACVTGLVLGVLGLLYVRRGRGSAAGARKG